MVICMQTLLTAELKRGLHICNASILQFLSEYDNPHGDLSHI